MSIMEIKLYPVVNSLIDVFVGDGWLGHSRWRKIKNHWIQVGGNKVEHPALIIKQLSQGGK